jgi:hypothetical protein
MSITHVTEAKRITAELIEPADLRALTNTLRFTRSSKDVDDALKAGADRMEAQSEIIRRQAQLIALQRTALAPFALAAPRLTGHDTDPALYGPGWRIDKGHIRAARKAWGSRP